ncbi:hypothetical protein [Methylotenera versatilis]|uniref:Uncharacterized protein n=1 Tax=Methylotenera versatilis (strain 301) TaxID=666681 RepID=D7DPA7_METV0|nr:hypothetical protein [Methylotenera versatilis]ADI29151.1 hypothetical protein M301_0767 [Methylotenera versatilis 301]
MTFSNNLFHKLFFIFGICLGLNVNAHEITNHNLSPKMMPFIVSVSNVNSEAPKDVTDIKFRDFFKMPIGKRGLELNDKFMSLDGKRVRILGYMAKVETPTSGMFVLASLPVELGDEDDSLSDDLPANSIFVHTDPKPFVVPHITGLISLTGTLSIGSQLEADGHVSMARLILDPEISKALEKEAIRVSAAIEK